MNKMLRWLLPAITCLTCWAVPAGAQTSAPPAA